MGRLQELACILRGRVLTCFVCLCILGCSNLSAIDPKQPLAQMHHTAWSAKEGVIGEVLAIAQTADGFIWIGTTSGLLRFDGSEFDRYEPEVGSFLQPRWVSALLATPDGGLWIGGLSGGASFLKDGKIHTYPQLDDMPPGRIRSFASDGDGIVWAATSGGLANFDGHRWRRVGVNQNFPGLPPDPPSTVAANAEGVWVSIAAKGVFWLDRANQAFRQVSSQVNPGYFPTFASAGTGETWLWTPESYSLQRFPAHAAQESLQGAGITTSAGMFLTDRDGGVWMMTRGEGVWRIPVAENLHGKISSDARSIEKFTEKDGLTSATVYCAMEDREGDIWVGTLGGLDRFRPRNATWTQLQSVATQRMQLVAGDEGEIWASSPQGLWSARNGKPVAKSPPNIQSSFRDPDGAIWFWSEHGNSGDLWRCKNGKFEKVMSPSRDPSSPAYDKWVPAKGPVRALTRDGSGDLWVSIRGGGVFRLHQNVWKRIAFLRDAAEMTAYGATTDDQGRVWLAYPEREAIGLWDHGSIKTFSPTDGLNIGAIAQIAFIEGQIWAAGEKGLAIYSKDRFRTVAPVGERSFGIIAGIDGSPRSGLWLNTASEIIHIPQAEVQRAIHESNYEVQYETFDPLTDLAEKPSATSDTPTVIGTDGIVWVATSRGIIRIDPAHIHRNSTPPKIAIRGVTADGAASSIYSAVSLPPHISRLSIGYSVLSFPIPERVRSHYRLLGYDKEWHDGGNRVDAPYYELGPGEYTFQVVAANNDGVWNATGSTLKFTIRPAFYQTIWFRFLYVLAAAAALWLVFLLRVRHMTAQVQLRYADRMTERTRIARELHDTLLQALQGLVLSFSNLISRVDAPPDVQAEMETVLGRADQLIISGRERVKDLRTEPRATEDLAAEIRAISDGVGVRTGQSVSLRSTGSPRMLNTIVREETLGIVREALSNAGRDSGASEVEIHIAFGKHELTMSVNDNGRGMDSRVTIAPQEGCLGLKGMRERAKAIGARLKVQRSLDRGTAIRLSVPGRLAYRTQKRGWLQRILPEHNDSDV